MPRLIFHMSIIPAIAYIFFIKPATADGKDAVKGLGT